MTQPKITTATDATRVQTMRPPVPSTMKAIVQHAYGSANDLKLETVDTPALGDDDVLIKVRAAAVNHADLVYTTGRPLIARLAFGLRKPKDGIRGKDVAGVVEAVGSNVTRFRPGDEVYGEVDNGSFAEYVVAPAGMVAVKPANLSFEQAATVPLAARTALQALRDGGLVQRGQRVLVNGASGGVGTFAVQLSRALGANVTAVCSTRNAEVVRSLGADQVIDYTREDFTQGGQRYDAILDLIGNHSLAAFRRALAPTGRLVLSSGTGGRVFGPMGRIVRALMLSPFVSQDLGVFTAVRGAAALDQLRDLIEAGTITPVVDRTYALAEAPEAVRYFAEEHARGKIVITVSTSGRNG
jgi:NADPH:quinone reductase-like Zn-dependent oxidoreductase